MMKVKLRIRITHQQMAHGLVKSGKSIQVVVGMTVPQVREAFEQMVEINSPKINNTKKDTSLYAIIVNDHRIDWRSFIMIYELSPEQNDHL